MEVKVKKLHPDAQIPKRMHGDDACFDIYAYKQTTIPARGRATVPTGISIALPKGYVSLIKDRSGLAAKHGLTKLAGVIDAGYRGEYLIVLYNTTDEAYVVEKGSRVAQLLILQLPDIEMVEVATLDESSRGEGGFGSTGK